MVCKIGGGSYGQVWMALSVTGAYRAVKIVAREDFRLERTFEREFEGIKKFEPISRGHRGLVDILHVGRSYEENFYFYVMELADDRHAAPGSIDPYQYEPRTLRSDILSEVPVSLDHCIRVGIELSNALHHLHHCGLSHRDVKPSNVIFVNGEAKLADIGLVAETGQQTFVGTEGFVPPEGPGTPQADIYSLGMVLYELSTGKDRLDFPELPDVLPLAIGDRERWQQFNRIVCQCCAPDRKKRFETAAQVSEALRMLAPNQSFASSWFGVPRKTLIWGAAAAMVLGGAVWLAMRPKPEEDLVQNSKKVPEEAGHLDSSAKDTTRQTSAMPAREPTETAEPIQTPNDEVIIQAEASDAWLYTSDGQEVGPLPVRYGDLTALGKADGEVTYPQAQRVTVSPKQVRKAENNVLQIPASKVAKRLSGWTNDLGIVFRYEIGKHLSKWPINRSLYERFLTEQTNVDELGSEVQFIEATSLYPAYDRANEEFVLVSESQASAFCVWMTAASEQAGYLKPRQRYRPVMIPVFAGRFSNAPQKLFRCELAVIPPKPG